MNFWIWTFCDERICYDRDELLDLDLLPREDDRLLLEDLEL